MNKAVVVAGMHRSGTSAIMGILQVLGVDIGDDLGAPDEFNEKGYFENRDFEVFEHLPLKHVTGQDAWDNPPTENSLNEILPMYEGQLKTLISKYSRSEIWGFKSARGLCFPEYLKQIPNLHLIVNIRSPEAVVASLKRRNGIDHNHAINLWSLHYWRLMKFLSRNEIPYMIVNYDDLVDTTETVMRKVSRFIGIEITEEQIDKGHDLIDERLRHHIKN